MRLKRKIKRYRIELPLDDLAEFMQSTMYTVNKIEWRDHAPCTCMMTSSNLRRGSDPAGWYGYCTIIYIKPGWDLKLLEPGTKYTTGIQVYKEVDFNLWRIGVQMAPETDEFTNGEKVKRKHFVKIEDGELGCANGNPFLICPEGGIPYGAWCYCDCCELIGRQTCLFDYYADEGEALICERCIGTVTVEVNQHAGGNDQVGAG